MRKEVELTVAAETKAVGFHKTRIGCQHAVFPFFNVNDPDGSSLDVADVNVALVVDAANGSGWFADGDNGVPVLRPIASGNDAIVRGIKVGYVKISETPTIGLVSAAAEIVVQY